MDCKLGCDCIVDADILETMIKTLIQKIYKGPKTVYQLNKDIFEVLQLTDPPFDGTGELIVRIQYLDHNGEFDIDFDPLPK